MERCASTPGQRNMEKRALLNDGGEEVENWSLASCPEFNTTINGYGNRPVDPGSIQGSHRPISFIRIKHRTRADDILYKTKY